MLFLLFNSKALHAISVLFDTGDYSPASHSSSAQEQFLLASVRNGPIESINRKVKDLKRLGRGFRNFEHFRNRFLFATRQTPVLDGVTDHNPVTYYEDDDF